MKTFTFKVNSVKTLLSLDTAGDFVFPVEDCYSPGTGFTS